MSMQKVKESTKSRVIKIVVFSAVLLLSPLAQAQRFAEGTHYSIVDGARDARSPKEIVEYFSFSCPGCNALEPYINSLQEQLSAASLRRVHLPFGGRKAGISQKAFVLLEVLNGAEHHQSVFDRIHLQKNVLDNEKELIEFFKDLGFSEFEVKQALNSFSADTMLRKMNNEAKKMNIRSAPTIIVNGKYQVNIRAVSSANSLAALVKYLTDLP